MSSEVRFQTRIHKFSSRPPGYDAARQRENQRRHRARVKGRIAELEAALSSTQSRLIDALSRIDTLTAEVRRLQCALESSPRPPSEPIAFLPNPPLAAASPFSPQPASTAASPSAGNAQPAQQTVAQSKLNELPSQQATRLHCEPGTCSSCTGTADQESAATATATATTRCTSRQLDVRNPRPKPVLTSPDSPPKSSFDDPADDCPLLPPAEAGESTIPCREAYSIIQDRSTPEFDLSVATEWLKPGFRRAPVPGAGCRVQTHVLFAFVDHITSI
ncbi:hypothetical protein N656DRAFT_798562 [Canariomyces notabilis]|uniref:BZIP domain-containing protein n=1 Tax=Canariomyces notabilis TaxID=2074819 RepID=A0AAN6YRI1_9PEZI|nr:hypothetical protein N656DRAFT_798562 [Canariomyces arenarius]